MVEDRLQMIKNKRGMLLASETLKMIIGVICIGFLVYLLVSIYYAKVEGEDKKDASLVMSRISNITLDLQNSPNKTSEIIYNIKPSGWKILFYVDDELKPNQCSGLNCLCICDDVWIEAFDGQVKECSEDGICEVMEDLIELEDIEIGDATDTSIVVFRSEGRLGVKRL